MGNSYFIIDLTTSNTAKFYVKKNKNKKMYFYKIGGSSQSIRTKSQFGGRVIFVLQADGQRYKFMLTLLD